jgi:hypothetical protein
MEYAEIKKLLNKYLEGETSLEEEALLHEQFHRTDLPGDDPELKEMFRYFLEARQETAPQFNITDELNALIANAHEKETRHRFRPLYAWIASAAAILLISLGIFQYLNKPEPTVKDTFKDPHLAYLETKRALLLISNTMNRNTANLKYLAKVDESFNHMKKIAEIDKVLNSVKNQ